MDIASMLEVQVKEMKVEADTKENVTPEKDQTSSTTSLATASISQEENDFYKHVFDSDIPSVRFRRLHCTACDVHIGSAPAQARNMYEHPVLRTLLCAHCYEFYGDGAFEQGDDATDMFCRWCANGGNLYCCSYCSNTFCYKCIRRNFTPLIRKKIEADEKWKCFVCNPSDLYTARAVCWALLQHIQTVTRILKNDKRMTAEEIEEKMNLDESTCCPRRSKRKRRRLESNSEEEDETYVPNVDELPVHIKRKLKKMKLSGQPTHTSPNGSMIKQRHNYSIMPIPIRPRPTSMLTGQSINHTEQPQSVIKREEPIINSSEGIGLSPSVINSNATLPSRYNSKVTVSRPQQHFYRTYLNTAGSSTYIQSRSDAVNPATHQIIFPPPPCPPPQLHPIPYQRPQSSLFQPSQLNSSQPLQSLPNTKLSISRLTNKHHKPRLLLPKPNQLNMMSTPNIIELNSDSDEETEVVAQQNLTVNGSNDIDIVDISSNKAVPVALTWENSDDDDNLREEQPLREMRTTLKRDTPSFSKIMLPHSQELDKLLSDMRKKMISFFNMNNAIQDVELEAQQKIKQFYWNMHATVFQLAHINDRVVREYNKWMRSQKIRMDTPSSTNENTLASRENIEIPLDMTCVNDSDTESNCDSSEYQTKEPSDFLNSYNIFKDILFKKNFVHRGVGDNNIHSFSDKATQVCDIILRDYEKCISHSSLRKTDYVPKIMDDSVSKSIATIDKNSGKYEEQFIFYLQHIEDNRNEEDVLIESNEMQPQEELTETNTPFLLHMLQTIDVSTNQSKNCDQEKNMENHINLETKNNKTLISTTNKGDKKITKDSNSDTRKQKRNVQFNRKSQRKRLQKTHNDTTDGVATSTSNNDDVSSNKNSDDIVKIETAVLIESEEDCAIIDA